MAEEPQTQPEKTQPQSNHWWQSVPAMMGAVATLLTAVTGLVVALKPSEPPQTSTPAVTPAAAQTLAPVQNSVQPVQVQTQSVPAQPLPTPNSVQSGQQVIPIPASSPVEANYTTSNSGDEKSSRKKRRKKNDD